MRSGGSFFFACSVFVLRECCAMVGLVLYGSLSVVRVDAAPNGVERLAIIFVSRSPILLSAKPSKRGDDAF